MGTSNPKFSILERKFSDSLQFKAQRQLPFPCRCHERHCTDRAISRVWYRVHVNAASERARVLIGLDETRCQRLGYEMELDELAYARQHLVVLLSAAVQTQHN